MIILKQRFCVPSFRLESGTTLAEATIGYETYGRLNAAGDNAILVAHYYSGTSHAAGRYRASDAEAGWWDSIIGPGKAIDTDRFFVVSADSLCNLHARNPDVITTGPLSIDPATNRPYGASFPVVTIGDFVELQKRLCDSLGVRRLHAVAGPSMGAMQAMEWTARFPDLVERALCVVPPALEADPYLIALLSSWCAPIRLDRAFLGGDYAPNAQPARGLTEAMKLVTLTAIHPDGVRKSYGRRFADETKPPLEGLAHGFLVDTALEQSARERSATMDANSFLRIARAVQLFSIADRKQRLRARYLYVSSRTDLLLPPDRARLAVAELRALGLRADLHEIGGERGHLEGVEGVAQAADAIREFLHSQVEEGSARKLRQGRVAPAVAAEARR